MAIFGVDIKDAGAALGSVGTLAKDIRAAITGKEINDPDTELKLATLDAEILKAQIAVNQAEAASPNIFVSGWRPALGWVGVAAFLIQFLASPILGAFGITVPKMDTGELWPMLAGILGLGTLRTVEKTQKVASR